MADWSKKNLIKNWSSSNNIQWTYMAFILSLKHYFSFDSFGCKLWLWSIQNHARHRFRAFARNHLKWLCCFIGIWADALISGRSSIWNCYIAQDSLQNFLICSCSFAVSLLRDQQMIAWWAALSATLACDKISRSPSKFRFPWQKSVITAQCLCLPNQPA